MGSYQYHVSKAASRAKDGDFAIEEIDKTLEELSGHRMDDDARWAVDAMYKTAEIALQSAHVHATLAQAIATKEK